MKHSNLSFGNNSKLIENRIDALSKISFDHYDYDIPDSVRMNSFYNYIQDKVIDKEIKTIHLSITEFITDEKEKNRLYELLWHSFDDFVTPHDEWSRDTMVAVSGVDFSEDD